MINSTTHNREEKKYKNWKKEIAELYLGKENTDVGTEEKISVWICTRHTRKPGRMGGQKWEIYNSIFTFKEDALIEKNGWPLLKENDMQRKGV